MTRRALILLNPRRTGGSVRHSEGWREMLEQDGFEITELLAGTSLRRPWRHLPTAIDIATGSTVPEALLWDPVEVRDALRTIEPDLIVMHTARAFLPRALSPEAVLILDFVDQLSLSYSQRAQVAPPLRRAALTLLALSHRRLERRALPGVHRAAVGAADAHALGARWLPLVQQPLPPPTVSPCDRPHDAVFFGSLDYAPNQEALRWLGTSSGASSVDLLVAGRGCPADLEQLIRDNGWTLLDGFESVTQLADLARVSIAPLQSVAGMQYKVLESAAVGLPIVATSASQAGFGIRIPARLADTPDDFVKSIDELSSDENQASRLAAEALTAVGSYSIDAGLDRLRLMIEPSPEAPRERSR